MSDIILFDYDLFGTIDQYNNIQTYINKDALINSLKIWFCSRAGDRLRNPVKGGFLDFQITKPMDDDRLANLRQRVKRALEIEFNNIFEVQSLTLTPVYNERLLEISLTVNCKSLNTNFDLAFRAKVL